MWYSASIWKFYDPHVFLGFLDPLHGPPDVAAPLLFAPAWPWHIDGEAGRKCGSWRTPVTWTYPQTSDMFEVDFPTFSIFQGGICWFPRLGTMICFLFGCYSFFSGVSSCVWWSFLLLRCWDVWHQVFGACFLFLPTLPRRSITGWLECHGRGISMNFVYISWVCCVWSITRLCLELQR